MANTATVQDVQPSDRAKVIVVKIALSGSYVQASRGNNTGEVVNLLTLSNPSAFPDPSFGPRGADRAYPLQGPAGFACRILPGADTNHWLIQIFGATNGTELAAGAYSGALTGDQDFYIAFEGKAY